jgi:hypothetical protein
VTLVALILRLFGLHLGTGGHASYGARYERLWDSPSTIPRASVVRL